MKNRTRPVRIEFRVTEQERQLIQKKMEQLGTKNTGAYLRKMAIEGYIIKVDYTEPPRESVEKAGILDIFPFFHTAQLEQKIRRKPQSPPSGVALGKL